MRYYLLAAAVAAATIAPPVFASEGGEGRIEARGGFAWIGDVHQGIAGVAAGYDFDLGSSVFAGPEISYDTDFDGTNLANVGGRIGIKASDKVRLYANVAYDYGDGDAVNAGAGAQINLNSQLYAKVEYRRYFYDLTDVNVVGVGLGMHF